MVCIGVCLLAMGLSTIVESLFTSVLGQEGLLEAWGVLMLLVAFIMGALVASHVHWRGFIGGMGGGM